MIGITAMVSILLIGGLAIYQNVMFEEKIKNLTQQQAESEEPTSDAVITEQECVQRIQSYKMLSDDVNIKMDENNYGINAIHDDEGFYCYRYNLTDELDAKNHENGHTQVQNAYAHFCKEVYYDS
jgi:hypothetical protein